MNEQGIKMKAFDFDGVFVPDYQQVDIHDALFERVWLHSKPIIEPSGDYIVITGRSDDMLVWTWFHKHLRNTPKMVYANTNNIKPEEHKLQTLNKLAITDFVESDLQQWDYLNKNGINCKLLKNIFNV